MERQWTEKREAHSGGKSKTLRMLRNGEGANVRNFLKKSEKIFFVDGWMAQEIQGETENFKIFNDFEQRLSSFILVSPIDTLFKNKDDIDFD